MANQTTRTSKREVQATDGAERAESRPVFRPLVDILETAEAVVLTADMPGADEETVEVTLEKNVLLIRGRLAPLPLEGYAPAWTEYDTGDYEASFQISTDIDRDRIEAGVRDGVLRVTLPKSQRAATQKIKVTAG